MHIIKENDLNWMNRDHDIRYILKMLIKFV